MTVTDQHGGEYVFYVIDKQNRYRVASEVNFINDWIYSNSWNEKVVLLPKQLSDGEAGNPWFSPPLRGETVEEYLQSYIDYLLNVQLNPENKGSPDSEAGKQLLSALELAANQNTNTAAELAIEKVDLLAQRIAKARVIRQVESGKTAQDYKSSLRDLQVSVERFSKPLESGRARPIVGINNLAVYPEIQALISQTIGDLKRERLV